MDDKKEEGTGYKITYDKKGRAFISFVVSNVPLAQWEEWNECCEHSFNSNRWQKIFLDHKMHGALDLLSSPPKVEVHEKKEITQLLGGGELEED